MIMAGMKILFVTFLAFEAVQTDFTSGWGYGPRNGPSTWAEDFPEFCAGIFQSPVDLPKPGLASGLVIKTYKKPLTFTDGYDHPISGQISNAGQTSRSGKHTSSAP